MLFRSDGTFRPDNMITRAEVVAIINRVLGRVPDEEYISDNLSSLNIFNDVSENHWAREEIIEASNNHFVLESLNTENWVD